jgi:hypothetical protein
MLEGQEASRILGVAIERVESMPSGAHGAEECMYWVTAAERQRLAKSEIARGIGAVGNTSKTLDKDGKEGFENLVAGALGAAIEARGDNKDQDAALILQVYRSRGQSMWDKLEAAQGNVKGATGIDFGVLGVQPVEGDGSNAMLLPGGHSIMALKGGVSSCWGSSNSRRDEIRQRRWLNWPPAGSKLDFESALWAS